MKLINYYVNSNSCRGYVSLRDSNFGGLRRVVRLNAYPAALAERLIGSLLERAREEDVSAELIHCCLDDRPEGVIFPEKSAGLINLAAYDPCEYNALRLLDDGTMNGVRDSLAAAHRALGEAIAVHDRWEAVYKANIDFARVDLLEQETAGLLLAGRTLPKAGGCVHRFFGAATVSGPRDYIGNLTEGLSRRYLLKGRPGTGKSTFLKKLAARAQEAGFFAELYHCALDPDSIDMLALRELDLCLFDSTAPHEYFPSRPGDEIIDIYARAVTPGTDEKFAEELSAVQLEYREKMREATRSLQAVREQYGNFEAEYFPLISGPVFDAVREKAERELLG